MSKSVSLEPGKYYHVYSRGNNRESIFVEERNHGYFLRLYAYYIEPVAETFAYCLMRNHFHVLVRVREVLLGENLTGLAPADLTGFRNLSGLAKQHFSNLLNAYAKAVNKAYGRTGALFERPFGRIEVASDAYFARLVVYIHRNPQKHGFVADFRDWPYSSYQTLLARQATRLKREEVLEWFGGRADLAAAHEQEMTDREALELAPEDFD
ncbi:MAG TPA: hypothetical protein PLJ35_03690 [Anaerolineae bacterium]|nr:hypothetical protein [Anaerolineae bacterium]HPL29011.1 hypothetical protein [Anaerolineae bacterium]